MRFQSIGSFTSKPSACGTVALAVMALVAVGCSSTSKIAQSPKGSVHLEEVSDWSFDASHPAVIDQATMMKIVKGLYSDESENGSSRMSAGGSKPMRSFSDEDAEFLTPLLVQGLSKAKPEQIVAFRVSSSAGSGIEPTTGSLYVQKGSVYFTIAKGAKATGFAPESVAHVESAPTYAAGGAAGVIAMVIDYHALAKAPAGSLPVAKPQAKSQATASVASAAGAEQATAQMAAEPVGMDELQQTKEALAKKDVEISMLRKESSWMKRELRDQAEEIKALRASKVSAKPAPAKKRAEANQAR
ncbi:conserved protein of unknown function [Nitrospira japonica]|uniref:Lipoprotein n=1 Tax=Nitrospira japonica TaxID=1325564 RepID=A0A1W1I8K6_9BACT|nr:hypothetical protein [Nitrospira japonica]SLM49352.1 conserved protein of unknown function [Nitrospira japonica]